VDVKEIFPKGGGTWKNPRKRTATGKNSRRNNPLPKTFSARGGLEPEDDVAAAPKRGAALKYMG